MTEFRIRGPLEVLRDGRPVVFPRQSLRKLPAMLLLEPGRIVPVERMVDALWDRAPPDTARRQVQNSAAMPRRPLGADARELSAAGDTELPERLWSERLIQLTVRVSPRSENEFHRVSKAHWRL
ncbi:MAG: AfsR/SARP family transcriptional regulator [Stackebrandtia sp.]